MAMNNQPPSSKARVPLWLKRWIDIPSIIGIVLIFVFVAWLVADYAAAIS